MTQLRLIVGLGNPGQQYAETRHNAGFWFVERLADRFGIDLAVEKKFVGLVGRGQVFGQDVRLLLPQTFMNRSGSSVATMAKFFDIRASEMLVVHDELDIAAGLVKFKLGGGHGGHNGLRDIVPHLGQDFARLRVGIGHPGDKSKVSGYVLGKPSLAEQVGIDLALEASVEALPLLLSGDLDRFRSAVNGFRPAL